MPVLGDSNTDEKPKADPPLPQPKAEPVKAAAKKAAPPAQKKAETPKFLSLADVDEFYHILWYADPGVGKTTAMADLARRGHIVYIDAENGLKPKALRRRGIPIENIEPWTDATYDGLIKLHQNLLLRTAEGEKIIGLCWDTGTETIRTMIKEVVGSAVTKAQLIGKDRTEFDVYQEDYGTVTEMMRKVLRLFHGLPMHLGIACHTRRDTDKDDGTIRLGPAVTPAVQKDMNGYTDCIINMRTQDFGDEELEFSGLTRPAGRFDAKDRYGLLPKNMINPTFCRVLDYLDEKIIKEEDPLQIEARQRRQPKEPEVAEPATT